MNSADKVERLEAELSYRTERLLGELDEVYARVDVLEGNLNAIFKVVRVLAQRLTAEEQEVLSSEVTQAPL